MPYSVTPILHNYADKNGLQKINIQVIYNRVRVYYPTDIKVQAKEFSDGQVIKHPLKNKYNLLIKSTTREIEGRILDALNGGGISTRDKLDEIVKGTDDSKSPVLSGYIYELIETLKGSIGAERLNHYKYMGAKVEKFQPGTKFAHITLEWLKEFEQYLRKSGMGENSVFHDINIILAVLRRADLAGLFQYENVRHYKRPQYKQNKVDYLSIEELDKLVAFLKVLEHPEMKLVGYYYALSCYTGYRFADAKRFNAEDVRNGQLVLRAAKNGTVVATPIFPRLQEIIDEIGGQPFPVSEPTARGYLRSLFQLIGITREFKSPYHSSRHTYAMQLMKKGLSRDEVAELIGDSALVAKIYARIENKDLSDKLMKIFGDLPASKTA